MIISIHIPKTAGTSFNRTLRSVYGEKGLLDLPATEEWEASNIDQVSVPDTTQCIHGHIKHGAFDEIYPEASKIVWLRDPVSRTISLYNHIVSFPDLNNEQHIKVHESNISLADFSGLPWVKNNALNYLQGTKPEDFLFIGFVEAFEASLSLCADLLNWSGSVKGFRVNSFRENISHGIYAQGSDAHDNAGKDHSGASDAEKEIIYYNNKEEIEWIRSAHDLFTKKLL